MPFIETNGVNFHYKLEGSSGPTVILLHEIGGSLDSWDEIVPGLAASARVFRYDQRGFGLTEKVRQGYSQSDLVDDLDALIRELKLAPPFHIVSLAASSMQALTFNDRHPSDVGSLIFCNPAPGVPPERAAALESVAAQAEQGGIRAIMGGMLDKSYPPSLSDRHTYDAYRGRYYANDPVGFAHAFRMMARTNMMASLGNIKAPTLVIAGRQDFIRAVSVTEGIAAKIAGARFETIDGGHFLPTTSPHALLSLLLDFLPGGAGTRAKINDITINYRVEGKEGAPWVVFSNSLATDLSMWDDQVAALKDRYRILRYDHRGHGGTDAPAGAYNFSTLVSDVVGLFDHLGIERAHFVGLSMGGMTALGLAQQHPNRVGKIIVADCGGASTPAGAAQWQERMQVATEKGMEALVEPTLGRWFPAEFIAKNPPVLDKVRAMIRRTPVNGFNGCAAALSDFDFRAGLAGMKMPTLFLCGTKDAAFGGLKALHAGVAGSKLAELDGAGHISNLEQPANFTQSIATFLDS